MNTLQLKGNWNVAKSRLEKNYAKLTDADLQFVEGQEDKLIGRIQKRTGETQEAVQQALSTCFADEL